MGQKTQLRLLASTTMSEKGENHLIRFPRKAREAFDFPGSQVVIGVGDYELSLTAKKAYRDDIQRLAAMLRNGKLTDAEAIKVGFVTRSVQQKIQRRGESNAWITTGVTNITIGCDPEFGLVDSEGILQWGRDVLPNSHNSQFGADGPGVEVRPSPSRDHIALVKKIKGIFRDPPERADRYQWMGGATYKDPHRVYWFGGHVHLGRPASLNCDYAHSCYQRIATALDHLVALPLVSFDTPEPYLRRSGCKHRYGMAGDIRADYPEQDRFEYRVLSGLWLTHPTLAKIVLGAAKCVTESAYQKSADEGWDLDWIAAPASRKGLLKSLGLKNMREVASLVNKAQPRKLKAEHIDVWKKQLRRLEFYDKYATEIKALVEIVKASPEKVVPGLSLDIRRNWQEDAPLQLKAGVALNRALERVEEKK